jgi:hypothetical protein
MGHADNHTALIARERWVDDRYWALHGALSFGPSTRCDAIWACQPRPTVALELVAWVCETDDSPEATLAAALTSAQARRDIIARFCEARAQAEAASLSADFFEEQ